jgi:flap endonuclease-1
MGVKLGKDVHGTKTDLHSLRGSCVGVDALNLIMIFLQRRYVPRITYPSSSSQQQKSIQSTLITEEPLVVDRTQRAISHLYGIFYRTINLLHHGIIPIYCFDGIADDFKHYNTKDRINDFKRTKERYQMAMNSGDYATAKSIALGKEFLWQNAIVETKELLTSMGVPIINSPTEGEAQCVELSKLGICDYVLSTDFDVLLYGCQKMLKINEFHGSKLSGIVYTLSDTEKQLKLNRFQVIDLSILIGNDYFPGIKSIGIKTGISLLQKYGSLDAMFYRSINGDAQFIQAIKNGITMDKINHIRKLFLMPEVVQKFPPISLSYPKRGGILNLMCVDHNLNRDRVEKGIQKLIKSYNKMSLRVISR